MPLSDIHKKKRRKNLVLLALIFAWCVLIWLITMVKMAHAEEMPVAAGIACAMDAKECPDGSYVSRSGPQCEFASCPGGDEDGDSIDEAFAAMEADDEMMFDDGDVDAGSAVAGDKDFIEDPGKWVAQRQDHQKLIDAQPAQWWENWQDKLDPEKK